MADLFQTFTSLMALLLWAGGFIFMLCQHRLGIAIWLVNIINGLYTALFHIEQVRLRQLLANFFHPMLRVRRDVGGGPGILAQDLRCQSDLVFVKEGDLFLQTDAWSL